MKQKIEALSNAFNIGFELGAKPYSGGHINFTKVALKRAIDEGLNMMFSQPRSQADAGHPCCLLQKKVYPENNFCGHCGRRIRITD